VLRSPKNAAQFEQMANWMVGAGILLCTLLVGLVTQMLLYRWLARQS
jgi:hypothetical protein